MPDIFAFFDHMLTRGHAAVSLYGGVVQRVGVFHHDDTVRTLGQHATGGDPGRFPGFDGKIGPDPHPDLSAYIQVGGIGLGCTEGGGCADGKSVHGGAIEIGNVHIGKRVFGQHPAQALGQRHRFRVHRCKSVYVGHDGLDGFYLEKLFHDIFISF
jgi:hypothetical protein